MNDICCIGHITLDKIVTPKQTTYMPGGTSYYFSHGISHLKDTKHYKLVTALAPTEFKAVEDIRTKGIEVKVIPSRRTVYFENTYGENQDNRTQRVWLKPTLSPWSNWRMWKRIFFIWEVCSPMTFPLM